MLRFVFCKIKNKKGLNLCLLLGITLFIALFVCHPMFERGAGNQVLRTGFETYAKEQETFPAVMNRSGSYSSKDYSSAKKVMDKLVAYEKKWIEYVAVDTVASEQYLSLSGGKADTSLGGTNEYFTIGYLPELSEYTDITYGQSLDSGNEEEAKDCYPCLVSEETMDAYGLVTGEVLHMKLQSEAEDYEVDFKVTGIIREKDINDSYWYHTLSDFGNTLFVSENTFDTMIESFGQDEISYEENLMLDYRQIDAKNAAEYADYMQQFRSSDTKYQDNMADTLASFFTKQRTIQQMLWALELPCLVLLLLFIYMVSSQMLSLEEGEIAVLRSRGATKLQVGMIYLLQASFLALLGAVFGLLLGYGMCKGAASTDGFLKFSRKNVSMYTLNGGMFFCAMLAAVIVILFLTMPALRRTKYTIVNERTAKNSVVKNPFWKKCYLDILLLLLSGYLLYNYNRQKESLAMEMIAGNGMDPVILLNTSVFILAAGLLFIRLFYYLILALDKVLKKRFRPAGYAAFLQLKRTWYQSGFLAVFLIMTIASGIFDANMARTMNQNMEERIAYGIGADAVLEENFRLQISKLEGKETNWKYLEPDFGRYEALIKENICENATRVLVDEKTDIKAGNGTVLGGKLMAIHTKEFGETARLKDGVNKEHWFYALNALAEEPDGVMISSNLADKLKLKVGDTLSYTRYLPAEIGEDTLGSRQAKVCAIIDCFPGYERYTYEKDEEGNLTEQEQYLLVANYATVISAFGQTPYQVWMKLADDVKDTTLTESLAAADIQPKHIILLQEQLADNRNSAMVQVTNGMFTLSFILSLVICSVGFLLYWMMTLKKRELLFGVYRAMGMRMGEVRQMILTEQLFTSAGPVLAGGEIGAVATLFFVRLLMVVYLPQKHNLAIEIYIYPADLVKLMAVLIAVMLLCYFIIRKILRSMKIAKALRLGEDS